jgi:hypothetical protein
LTFPYAPPFAFTGKLGKVTVELKPPPEDRAKEGKQ